MGRIILIINVIIMSKSNEIIEILKSKLFNVTFFKLDTGFSVILSHYKLGDFYTSINPPALQERFSGMDQYEALSECINWITEVVNDEQSQIGIIAYVKSILIRVL